MTLMMGIGVFAAEDPTALDADVDLAPNEAPMDNPFGILSLEYVAEDRVDIAQGEIFLVMDDRIVEPEMRMEPNSEYTMDVYYADAAVTNFDVTSNVSDNANFKQLMENDLVITGAKNNAKLRMRSGKGTSVMASAKLDTTGVGASKRYIVDFET